MNTTLVFAELLVIGLEGGIWLSFLYFTLFGTKLIETFLLYFKGWEFAASTMVLALVYVFGVILDRFADKVFRTKEAEIDHELGSLLPIPIVVIRYSLGTQNDFLNQQLEYTRSRARIVRASAINLPLISLFLSSYLYVQSPQLSYQLRGEYILVALATGYFACLAACLTWVSLKKAHLKLARTMFEHLNKNGSKKTGKKHK